VGPPPPSSADPMLILDSEDGLDHRFSAKGFYGTGIYGAKKVSIVSIVSTVSIVSIVSMVSMVSMVSIVSMVSMVSMVCKVRIV
jgi:hypothetical protein